MSTKIGLISDVHATPAPLREALEIFQGEGVETILCAGDIAGYGTELEETVALLNDSQCRAVLGNHDLWYLWRKENSFGGFVVDYLQNLPVVIEMVVEGKRIYMVHASPPDSVMDGIRLLDEQGELIKQQKDDWRSTLLDVPYDLLLVGHTHQVFAEYLGSTLVVNPGSTKFNHTCAILSLPDMDLEILPLSQRAPLLSWNWGMGGY